MIKENPKANKFYNVTDISRKKPTYSTYLKHKYRIVKKTDDEKARVEKLSTELRDILGEDHIIRVFRRKDDVIRVQFNVNGTEISYALKDGVTDDLSALKWNLLGACAILTYNGNKDDIE